MSPQNCPKNKIETNACLLCSDNRDGYCWGLCPPKDNRQPINDILTLEERISILESRFENHAYLESEVDRLNDTEQRLINLEELSYRMESRLNSLQEAESKFNAMYDTLNNTLSNFSKKLVSLENNNFSIKRGDIF